jgi:diacylglycerol kinase family enzyme
MELQREGKTQRRCFPALGGAGMDGRACELVNWETKKRSGQFAYLTAGYRAAMEPLPAMRVVADGRVIESAELIMLGNGPFYGGPFNVFPAAQLDDGKVDAIIAERVQKWRTPEYLWGLLTGNLPSLAGVHYVQAASIELSPVNGERVAVQLDGDATGELPATISVSPRALRMVAPAPVG